MRIIHLSCSVGILLLLTGCATIIHGKTEKVSVSSTPTNAQVTVKGIPVASTPSIIELKRKDTDTVLRFEKEDYEPGEVILNRKYSGWIAGNLAIPMVGFIGGIIDFGTGAAFKLVPAEAYIDLQKQEMREDDSSREEIVVIVGPDSSSRSIKKKDIPTPSKPAKKHPLIYGYGVSGIYIMLPVPFIECGLRIGSVSVRGNIGGLPMGYGETRVELALLDHFFMYGGKSQFADEDTEDIYGMGIDINARDKRSYYRFEIGFWDKERKPWVKKEPRNYGRIGLGWRF
jgi:hypothetical protein